ncbi:pirin family protein [Arthrobacter sp. UM1]|nr:pirin family protein [Arthrobacter sp. UM1]
MTVRRTLPARERSLIGAWCFLDHYGPDDVSQTGGMNVPAHPHTGLQTVSWLFTGEIDHRDSAGHAARVRPGELNLMTAGRGINHSEFTAAGTTVLHGCQLWVALPDGSRFTDPGFEHYAPEPLELPGATVRVFLGSLLGETSPVTAFSPLLGAEILLDDGATLDLPLNPGFEHGVLVDQMPSGGVVEPAGESGAVEGTPESGVVGLAVEGGEAREIRPSELAAVDAGATRMTLSARGGPARLLLLGGEPFGEEILMWWNFVGRTHDEVAAFRAEWQEEIGARQAEIGAETPGTAPRSGGPEHDDGGRPPHIPDTSRYGAPVTEETIPAPALPKVRLRTRGNRRRGEPGRGGDRKTGPTGDHSAGRVREREAGQNGDRS